MTRRLWLALLAALAVGLIASFAMGATPPPWRHGAMQGRHTYSYSQTRSGTCSHHGGVAVWLTPATTTPSATTVTPVTTAPTTTNATTTAAPTTTPAPGTIDVGKTILLAKRTKTSGCKLAATLTAAAHPAPTTQS
jgi:hypothetical protein